MRLYFLTETFITYCEVKIKNLQDDNNNICKNNVQVHICVTVGMLTLTYTYIYLCVNRKKIWRNDYP